jgi:hypothetical protein
MGYDGRCHCCGSGPDLELDLIVHWLSLGTPSLASSERGLSFPRTSTAETV